MPEFLRDSIYGVFRNQVLQYNNLKEFSWELERDWYPWDLFLYSFEAKFIQKLKREKKSFAVAFN